MRGLGQWAAILAMALGLSAPAVAVDHTVSVFIADHDGVATACDFGALARVDMAVQTNADGSGQVTASSVSTCDAGSFVAPQALPGNVGPIAMRAGIDGFHPVEFALPSPFGELPDGATLRLVVEGSTAEDFFSFSQVPNTKGDPILFVVPAGTGVPPPAGVQPPTVIPVMGPVTLGVLLLGIVLVVTLGKRYRRMLPVLLLGASAGLMAQVGGLRFDWSDGPLVEGNTVQPDASPDVRAIFARADRLPGLQLAFRLDLGLQSEPLTVTLAGSPLVLEVGGAPGELILANTSTVATAGNLSVDLPPAWTDVTQDNSDCFTLAPGASCSIALTPGSTAYPSEAVVIRGSNTVPVNATIQVQPASVPVLTAVGSPLQLAANGPAGSIVVTNLVSSPGAATNVMATLPPGWSDVTQDASGCVSIAPGASCTLNFTPGATVHPAEAIVIAGDNTQAITVSIEVTPAVPTLLSLSPNTGPITGGTTVVLSGANLEGTMAVTFGPWSATISSVSSTQVEVMTPSAGNGTTVDVTVLTQAGNATLVGAYTYFVPTYVVGGVVTGLAGSVVLTNVVNDDSITVTADGPFTMPTPLQSGFGYNIAVAAQPAGQTCVVVNGNSFINAADALNVQVNCTQNLPVLAALSPASGPTAGGLVITATGSGFTGATALTFDGLPASVLTVLSDTSVQGVIPPHAAGVVNVVLVHPAGTSAPLPFTYEAPAVFTIGGTVTGLVGALTLQNNGGDTLAVNSDGSFTFSTPVISGGVYNITVATQPATQTCSVSNGTGTVGGANVTNVQVQCTPVMHTIGGSVSGLTFGSVGLLNGSDSVSIPSGATSFSFPAPVPLGSNYNVVFATTPIGMNCSLANASGLVTADVTNVQVTCVPQPSITSITPNIGPSMGGVGVTLTGTGFTGITSVTFGGVPATAVNVIDATTITAVTPAHAPGLVTVSAQRPGLTIVEPSGFTYVASAVGQATSGGVLACLNGGLNNLVATTADQATLAWSSTTAVTNATSSADGASNTVQILATDPAPGFAASTCAAHEVDSQGNTPCQPGNVCYNDWFLPAHVQVACLYDNRVAVGGFTPGVYWSSTEANATFATMINFTNGVGSFDVKGSFQGARCVRAITP